MLNDNQIIRLIFGFKVRYLRQQKGLSYQQLADQTGLSTSYLHDIEKGKRYPKPDKITTLATAFDVDYNYMVATNASKRLQPIIDLITSKFFKLFPLHKFGLSLEKILELFSQTPDKVNAFISTLFKIARSYQIDESKFYQEALRSYQDMHNNYFPDIEKATQIFKEDFSIKGTLPYTSQFLEDQLFELYGISIDRQGLSSDPLLQKVRSYYHLRSKTLYIQRHLTEAQINFLIARELGFQHLNLIDRPYISTIVQSRSFEELLNNYKASHFAAALLMDEKSLAVDFKKVVNTNKWNPTPLANLLKKYNVTGEMLLQRLTNILHRHFGLPDLFFIRLSEQKSNLYDMTKDLHLSQLHSPYSNEQEEHYCRRWVSVSSIQDFKAQSKAPFLIDAQISKYWKTDKEYLCISIAKPSFNNKALGTSVTLGLLVTPQLRSQFYFLNDPNLKVREVHTTCERCGISDCIQRVKAPRVLEDKIKEQEVLDAIHNLNDRNAG